MRQCTRIMLRKLDRSSRATQACPSSTLEAPSQPKDFQFLSKKYLPTDDSAECFSAAYFDVFSIYVISSGRIRRGLGGGGRGQAETLSRHSVCCVSDPNGIESNSLPVERLLRLQNANNCHHNSSGFQVMGVFVPSTQRHYRRLILLLILLHVLVVRPS
jgi:hypothetical protein